MYAFLEKARKTTIIMKTSNQKINDQFQVSKTDAVFCNVKDKDGKIHICVGKHAVSSKTFDTYEQADKYIGCKPWEIIINMCAIMYKNLQENETNENFEETAKDA